MYVLEGVNMLIIFLNFFWKNILVRIKFTVC